MYSVLALRALHTKERNLYKLSKEWYFCLTRNRRNSIQRQTQVNSVASTIHIGRILMSTTVIMTLYHRHALKCVINTTTTSRWCGLTDTWKIHYNSNFKTVSSSHVFWRKLSRLVSTLSTAIVLENWCANFPSPNWVTHVEYLIIFVDCYEQSHTPLR
jgi:hypothetical protein